jgi:hypothetical protein
MAPVQGVLAIGFRREARSSRKAPEENNEAGSWSGVVVHQNDPIARFTGKEMLKRVVHIGHWEGFGNRCYRVACTELEHDTDGRWAANRRTGNRLLPHDQPKGRNGHGFEDGSDDMEPAVGGQCSEQARNIERSVNR